MKKPPEEAFSTRIALVLIVLLVVLLNVGGLYLYEIAFEQLNDEWGRRLKSTALVSAEGISDLLRERYWSQEDEREFEERVQLWMKTIREKAALRYAVFIASRDNSTVIQAGLQPGTEQILLDVDRAEIEEAWDGLASDTEYYEFEGLRYKRAYAPVLDAQGTVVAVVGLEADASFFDALAQIERSLWLLAGFSVLVCLGAVVLIHRMAKSFIRVEEALARSERALELDQLASSFAHEIRNPLGIILASAEFLLEQTEDSEHREMLADLVQEAEHLERMVHSVLTRMTSDSGEMERFSPFEVVQECADQFRRSLDSPNIEVMVSLPSDSGSAPSVLARGESIKFEGAIMNLLRNAREAMPQGGKIELGVENNEQTVRIYVRDNGPGISRRALRRVFLPFYSEKKQGTGLGLPTVRRILREFGGEVAVKARKGRGTEVSLIVPKETAQNLPCREDLSNEIRDVERGDAE